jgi:nicotinate-nucleotide adenylyltransferase
MNSIALFGGSFDPPHLGHVAVVDAILSTLDIKKVIIMPAYLNPFKSKVFAPPELRLKWLKGIFSSYDKVEVDDFELQCKRSVTTLETLRYLQKKYEKIYLVIGADNLAKLSDWHGYKELKKLVTFVVASRDDIEIPQGYIALHVDAPVSSTTLRNKMKKEFLPTPVAEQIVQYYKEQH